MDLYLSIRYMSRLRKSDCFQTLRTCTNRKKKDLEFCFSMNNYKFAARVMIWVECDELTINYESVKLSLGV